MFAARRGGSLGNFVEEHDLGRVMSNDSGVITERDPDTVRGADVAYYSYARLPEGRCHGLRARGPRTRRRGPLDPRPLATSSRRSWNTWMPASWSSSSSIPKPGPRTSTACRRRAERLGSEDELTFPGLLEGFSARVGRFFE